jgi:radical SAM protein with 4Fe4S-binding SPASM domain
MRTSTIDHLIARQTESLVPFSVGFEMTSRCNEDCSHCVRSRWMGNELTYDEIVDILQQLAEEGAMELTYTGGDPLVRPDFLPIMRKSHALGFALFLFTNATLITPDIARELARLRVQEVDVSVYGVTPEVHDGITRLKGSLRRTMAGIGHLDAAGIPVNVKMVLMKQNFHELPALKALCAERGWNFRYDYILFPRDDGSTDVWDARISEDQIRIADRMQKDDELRQALRAARGPALPALPDLTVIDDPDRIPLEAWHAIEASAGASGPIGLAESHCTLASEREAAGLISADAIGSMDAPAPERPAKKGVCSAGWNSVSITSWGEVLPCITWRMSLGNLRKQPFREIWHHSPLLARIRSLTHADFDTACSSCGVISKCHKCPGLAYSEHRNPLLPSSDRCRATKAIHILEGTHAAAEAAS